MNAGKVKIFAVACLLLLQAVGFVSAQNGENEVGDGDSGQGEPGKQDTVVTNFVHFYLQQEFYVCVFVGVAMGCCKPYRRMVAPPLIMPAVIVQRPKFQTANQSKLHFLNLKVIFDRFNGAFTLLCCIYEPLILSKSVSDARAALRIINFTLL